MDFQCYCFPSTNVCAFVGYKLTDLLKKSAAVNAGEIRAFTVVGSRKIMLINDKNMQELRP